METLRYLISFFLKCAVGFFVFAVVWWIAALFVPSLSFRTLIPTLIGSKDANGERHDLLPSPRQFKGLFANTGKANEYYNVYVPGPAYDGYGLNGKNGGQYSYSNNVAYITYTSTGTSVSGGGSYDPTKGIVDYTPSPGTTVSEKPAAPVEVGRSVYIRNLSIYGGSEMRTGLSFIGEARSTMFRNGIFPIVLVDAQRRVIGVSTARATTDWTVAGWTRFETTLPYPVPKIGTCTLIFEQALTDQEKAGKVVPVRVPINVTCK